MRTLSRIGDVVRAFIGFVRFFRWTVPSVSVWLWNTGKIGRRLGKTRIFIPDSACGPAGTVIAPGETMSGVSGRPILVVLMLPFGLGSFPVDHVIAGKRYGVERLRQLNLEHHEVFIPEAHFTDYEI